MAAGAVSLRKSHDIVISSFCNIVKGQAKHMYVFTQTHGNFWQKKLSSDWRHFAILTYIYTYI